MSVTDSGAVAAMRRPSKIDAVRGPTLITLLAVIPIVLWIVADVPVDRFMDTRTTLSSLSLLCAVAGVTLFALNLIVGARVRPLALFFGTLDRLYLTHRVTGRTAYLFLLAHVAFVFSARAVDSLSSAFDLFVPGRPGWTVTYGAIAFLVMTISIYLTQFVRHRMNHEVFIWVQRSFGFVFMVAGLHVFMTAGTKQYSSSLTYYLGALYALALAAFAYRSLFGDTLVRRLEFEVAGVRHLGAQVTEITMEPLGEPLHFVPGQFVFATFKSKAMREKFRPVDVDASSETAMITMRPGAISRQAHPFSITSAPGERQLKIAVKALGDYTRALRELEVGAWAAIEGPYGAFSYRKIGNRKQIWIAGGIGVTPFLSMARSLHETEYEIDFYYAVKHESEANFIDDFYAIADKDPKLKVIPIVKDKLGHATVDDIEALSKDLLRKDILICGPKAMVDVMVKELTLRGVPRRQIHFERFGFAG